MCMRGSLILPTMESLCITSTSKGIKFVIVVSLILLTTLLFCGWMEGQDARRWLGWLQSMDRSCSNPEPPKCTSIHTVGIEMLVWFICKHLLGLDFLMPLKLIWRQMILRQPLIIWQEYWSFSRSFLLWKGMISTWQDKATLGFMCQC